MRKDVKAGMGLALIVVIVAGWYYTRDNSPRESIALGPESPATRTTTETPTAATASAEQDGSTGQPSLMATQRTSRTRSADRPARAERTGLSSRDRSPVSENRNAVTTDRSDTDRSASARSEQIKREEQRKGAMQPGELPGPIPLLGERLLAGGPEPAEPNDDDVSELLVSPQYGGSARGTQEAGPTPGKNRQDQGGQPGAPAEALEAVEFYKVQPDDTLEKLANIYYGNVAYAELIQRANPAIRDPNVLRVGMELRLPAVPQGTAVAAAGTSPEDPVRATDAAKAGEPAMARTVAAQASTVRFYVVRSGDSFYRIAERQLGSGARWPELLELNRELVNGDPQRLRPGMELRLPPQ